MSSLVVVSVYTSETVTAFQVGYCTYSGCCNAAVCREMLSCVRVLGKSRPIDYSGSTLVVILNNTTPGEGRYYVGRQAVLHNS